MICPVSSADRSRNVSSELSSARLLARRAWSAVLLCTDDDAVVVDMVVLFGWWLCGEEVGGIWWFGVGEGSFFILLLYGVQPRNLLRAEIELTNKIAGYEALYSRSRPSCPLANFGMSCQPAFLTHLVSLDYTLSISKYQSYQCRGHMDASVVCVRSI